MDCDTVFYVGHKETQSHFTVIFQVWCYRAGSYQISLIWKDVPERLKSCKPEVSQEAWGVWWRPPFSDFSFWQPTYLRGCFLQEEIHSLRKHYLRYISSACWGLCFRSRQHTSTFPESQLNSCSSPYKHIGLRPDGEINVCLGRLSAPFSKAGMTLQLCPV